MDMRVARGGRLLLILLVLVLGVEVLMSVTALLLHHGVRGDEAMLLGIIGATVVLSATVRPIRVRRQGATRADGVARGHAEA